MRSSLATGKNLRAAKEAAKEALSSVRSKDYPIAILGSDLHLTNKTPVARAEKDWLEVLANYLRQVKALCMRHDVPFVVAGDIFDKPNPAPEVINMALDSLPMKTIAVPGQHDLAYHNYEDIEKTAYWTLVKADRIRHLVRGGRRHKWLDRGDSGWDIVGWPWGTEPEPIEKTDRKVLAVIHSYIWKIGNKFSNAPRDANVYRWKGKLKGYDAAVFGDNHKGFISVSEPQPAIINCGTFTCRKTDERDYKPFVGVLHKSGMIWQCLLDTSKDKWNTPEQMLAKIEDEADFSEVVKELNSLGSDSLDFMQALKAAMAANQVGRVIGDIIRKAAEEKK